MGPSRSDLGIQFAAAIGSGGVVTSWSQSGVDPDQADPKSVSNRLTAARLFHRVDVDVVASDGRRTWGSRVVRRRDRSPGRTHATPRPRRRGGPPAVSVAAEATPRRSRAGASHVRTSWFSSARNRSRGPPEGFFRPRRLSLTQCVWWTRSVRPLEEPSRDQLHDLRVVTRPNALAVRRYASTSPRMTASTWAPCCAPS